MSTKGAESAQKAFRWRGPARRKEQGNGRDSIQVSQFTTIFLTVKNKWREMCTKNKPGMLLILFWNPLLMAGKIGYMQFPTFSPFLKKLISYAGKPVVY